MALRQDFGTKLARASREGPGFLLPVTGMGKSTLPASRARPCHLLTRPTTLAWGAEEVPFEVSEQPVLPSLIAVRRADGQLGLHVWSGGVSSVEETDSFAVWPDWFLLALV